KMKSRLNRKLFVALMAGAAACAVGVHLLHGAQVRRTAPALLEQALAFEKQKGFADCAGFLELYLKRAPGDADARVRYALLRVKMAHATKEVEGALAGLEDILRNHSDREDVRREAVRLAMSPALNRHADAQFHLDRLIEAKPRDGELALLYAQCLLGQKRYS